MREIDIADWWEVLEEQACREKEERKLEKKRLRDVRKKKKDTE